MAVSSILIILIFCVVAIVVATSILKLHPFISLLLVSILAGFLFAMEPSQILTTIASGFGGILTYIGIVIVLGSVLGEMLEKSGAAQSIATFMLKGVGARNPTLALTFLGAIVGIPVFCDTGFIILSKLTDTIAASKGLSPKRLSVGLATGLYTTHTLIPPTPGPIAAAGNLGVSDYLGLVMMLGFAVMIPVVVGSYFVISRMNFKAEVVLTPTAAEEKKDELPIWRSIFPIVMPIVLIAGGTVLKLLQLEFRGSTIFLFFCEPAVALMLAVLLGYFTLRVGTMSRFSDQLTAGVAAAGPILIITGAGGAFGAILKASDLAGGLETLFLAYSISGKSLILIAFAIAAILKTAQGSSTSSIVITSSLISPFLALAGFQGPYEIALIVMAIGGGAMTFSHANDSYFWVVSQFGKLSLQEAYRSYTIVTLVQGFIALATVWLLALLI